jgi:hypothetical protein
MKLPRDFTIEEAELFQFLTKGVDCLIDTSEIYQKIDNDLDRFIVCYVFEAGYTRKSLERVLGMTKSEIHTRIKNIKSELYRNYKNSHLLK